MSFRWLRKEDEKGRINQGAEGSGLVEEVKAAWSRFFSRGLDKRVFGWEWMKTVVTGQWIAERFLGAGAHLRSVLIELEEAIEYWHYREAGVEWEVVCDRATDVVGLSQQVERATRELRGVGARTEQARLWGTYLVGVAYSRLGRYEEAGRYFLAARALRSTGRGGQEVRAIIERAAAAACLAVGDYERAYEQARMIEQRVILIGTSEHILSSGERTEATQLLEIESGILSGALTDLGHRTTSTCAYNELIETLHSLQEEGISERSLSLIERGLSDEERPSALIASYLGLWRGLQQRLGELSNERYELLGQRVEQMARALLSYGFCVGRVKRYEKISEQLVAGAFKGAVEEEVSGADLDGGAVGGASTTPLFVRARSLRAKEQEGALEGVSEAEAVSSQDTKEKKGEVLGVEVYCGDDSQALDERSAKVEEGEERRSVLPKTEADITKSREEVEQGFAKGINSDSTKVSGVGRDQRRRSDWEWEINRWGWHSITTVIGHEGASGRMEVWLEGEEHSQLLGWVEHAQGGYWEARSCAAQILSHDLYVGRRTVNEEAPPADESRPAEAEATWDIGVEALWDLYVTCNWVYQRGAMGIESGITEPSTGAAQPELRGRFFRKGLFDLSPTGSLNGVRVTGYDFELARLYDEVIAGVKTPTLAIAELRGQLVSENEDFADVGGDIEDEGDLDWEAFERAFSPRTELAKDTKDGEETAQSRESREWDSPRKAPLDAVGSDLKTEVEDVQSNIQEEGRRKGRILGSSSGWGSETTTESSIDLRVLTAGSIGEIFALLSERYCRRVQVWVRSPAGYALLYSFGEGLIQVEIGEEISATELKQQLRSLSEKTEQIGYELGIGYAIVFEVHEGRRREYVQLIFRAWEWGVSGKAVHEEFDFSTTEGFIYGDPTTERLLWRVRRLAEHDGLEGRPLAHVLLVGERGVGKERIAKLIHVWSGRREFPYVVCNGAVLGLNATLATAELFGAEPGAYTDAPRSGRRGFVEQAGIGTLFIDEVNELTSEVAGLLKRVVQEGDYARLGSTKRERARCRFVLATNRPERLPEDVRDRFYTLEIPPLRARLGDIGPLAQHFAAVYGCTIDVKLIDYFRHQSWAGNIRQLERTIYELATFSPGRHIDEQPYMLSLRDLKATLGRLEEIEETWSTESSTDVEEKVEISHTTGTHQTESVEHGVVIETILQHGPRTLEEARALLDNIGRNMSEGTERFKRAMVEAALMLEGGNQTRAARRLGISRQGLRKLLESLSESTQSK